MRSDKALQLMRNTRINKKGCWIWTKAKQKGYGAIWNGSKVVRAHREMFQLMNPTIDISKACVCHHCDVKACINPDHLYAGTKSTNYRDAINRGQLIPLSGEAHPRAKLSAADVSKIRALLKQGFGKRELGRKFMVHHSQIVRISSGERWHGVE